MNDINKVAAENVDPVAPTKELPEGQEVEGDSVTPKE